MPPLRAAAELLNAVVGSGLADMATEGRSEMKYAAALREWGWVELPSLKSTECIRRLGESLAAGGVSDIQSLSPLPKGVGRGHSFSDAFGWDHFPLHTDTSFWSEPARYVVMQSPVDSPTATLLLDRQKVASLLMQPSAARAIFRCRRKDGPIYSGLTQNTKGMPGWAVRFDPTHMVAANDAAKDFMRLVDAALSDAKQFHYSGENALLIDNWVCLHGRGPVAPTDRERVLLRAYIGGRK